MSIEEIKARLPITDVLHHYGLHPNKNKMLHCPFHDDKTPSMQVYPETNTVFCFSSNCKLHGKALDVIDFVMYMENSTKHQAIEQCKGLIKGSSSGDTARSTSSATNQDLSSIAVLTKMFTYFKNAVRSSPPAREYIGSRALDYTKLEIGYNTGQFHHGSRKNEALIQSCKEVGLLSPFGTNNRTGGQAYKPFAKNCICFALKNRAGQVSGLYFRSTANDKNQRPGETPKGGPVSPGKHFYLKNRQGLYPNYPKPDTTHLILTESIIDAASLIQQEEINKRYSILALYGTNGLTEEHIQAIKALENLEEIIFFLNGDEPGRKAVEKHAKTLSEAKSRSTAGQTTISTVNVPDKEDVNSLLQAHQPDIFTHLLETRTPIESRRDHFSFSQGVLRTTENSTENKTPRKESPEKKAPEQQPGGLNTTNPNKLTYTGKTAHYAILGGVSKQLDSMKVTLQIQPGGIPSEMGRQSRIPPGKPNGTPNRKTRHKLDLYEDSQIEKTCKKVSEKLNIPTDLLEEDLYHLTDLLDEHREHITTENKETPETTPLTAKERAELETFAKQPRLIERIGKLLGKTGITGEEHNRIFLFLIAFSHKLPETLHALIQGSSGSGKTRLMRQVSDCMPPENVDRFTRISDKALYNFPETYFVNHLLCLEDMDGLSEEAEYSARELISGGELRSAVSVKDENGRIGEGQKIVKGPVASLSCTTKGEIYEDNMSRVFLIAVDESPQQTERIIEYQNNKSAGILNRSSEEQTRAFLQRLTRFLQPCEVINPYAGKLTLPREAHKIRRLNELFQGFIKIITVVNQYQRKKDEQGNLVATTQDIETAIEIMFESIVLKVDELDGSLRNFYEALKSYIQKKDREFTQREIRHALGVSKTQMHRYFRTLIELEYLQQSGGYANRGYTYKITYWDNIEKLRARIKDGLYSQLEALKG